MNQARSQTIVMDGFGSYLGMEKGCFTLKDKKGNVERYPLFENQLKEVVLRSGNSVSTGALSSLGFWGVDVLVMTQRARAYRNRIHFFYRINGTMQKLENVF